MRAPTIGRRCGRARVYRMPDASKARTVEQHFDADEAATAWIAEMRQAQAERANGGAR